MASQRQSRPPHPAAVPRARARTLPPGAGRMGLGWCRALGARPARQGRPLWPGVRWRRGAGRCSGTALARRWARTWRPLPQHTRRLPHSPRRKRRPARHTWGLVTWTCDHPACLAASRSGACRHKPSRPPAVSEGAAGTPAPPAKAWGWPWAGLRGWLERRARAPAPGQRRWAAPAGASRLGALCPLARRGARCPGLCGPAGWLPVALPVACDPA
mmetsp:Transcript_32968/g.101301  ORF Transcript_32968/g.101301 Transcript_32968/m.101301 type:complete len:215 (-) Transcript_32968:9-653(-)